MFAYDHLWGRCQPEELLMLRMEALLTSRSFEKVVFLLTACFNLQHCHSIKGFLEVQILCYLILTAENTRVPWQMQADFIVICDRNASCAYLSGPFSGDVSAFCASSKVIRADKMSYSCSLGHLHPTLSQERCQAWNE